MAFSEKTTKLMEDTDFLAKLEKAEDVDACKAIFAAEGIDFDAEFAGDDEEMDVELSAEDLDDVAGGLSTKDLVRIVKNSYKIFKGGPVSWAKFGASGGVLLRAYYDLTVYKNVTRSYSAKEIERAAKYMGCM